MQNIYRKRYTVQFIRYSNQWAVINTMDGVAQSAWTNRADANSVASTLNSAAA